VNSTLPLSRTPLQITASVWRALILREMVQRLFSARGAWAWLLVEPLFHAGYLTLIYSVIRVRTIGGIDTVIWLLSGLMGYFLFSRTVAQVSGALGANRPLFSYRQVKPLDAAFARAVLEASLMTVITVVVFTGAVLLGHDFKPDAPLTVLLAFACAWLIGLGWGLIVSVSKELLPELGTLIDLLIQRPLYLVSGVIMPMTALPSSIRELLMLNPLAHVFEIVRAGVASHYHAAPESDLTYAFVSALVLIFIGMLLMRRFAWKILAQ
jgi:capsular polysaccharide transport system permease protein